MQLLLSIFDGHGVSSNLCIISTQWRH